MNKEKTNSKVRGNGVRLGGFNDVLTFKRGVKSFCGALHKRKAFFPFFSLLPPVVIPRFYIKTNKNNL
jgi:hypothetical protein